MTEIAPLFRLRAFVTDWIEPLRSYDQGLLTDVLIAEAKQWVALGVQAGYFADEPVDIPSAWDGWTRWFDRVLPQLPDLDDFAYRLTEAQDDLSTARREYLQAVVFAEDADWDRRLHQLASFTEQVVAGSVAEPARLDRFAWAMYGSESAIEGDGARLPAGWRSSDAEIVATLFPWIPSRVAALEEVRAPLLGVAEAQAGSSGTAAGPLPSIAYAPVFAQRRGGDGSRGTRGTFTVEPLDRGLAPALGGALRRALLGSLEGWAVTAVSIVGLGDDRTTAVGVRESLEDIARNLGNIVLRARPGTAAIDGWIDGRGPGAVTAADISLPPGVDVLDTDTHIVTLERDARFEAHLFVSRGRGHASTDEVRDRAAPPGAIPIAATFSPVARVAYRVEPVLAVRNAVHDRLVLDIETNGVLDPQEALVEASAVLAAQFEVFRGYRPGSVARGSAEPFELDAPLPPELA